jgi:hypothetical protein
MAIVKVHLKKQHGMDIQSPSSSAEFVESTKVFHKCQICDKKLVHSLAVIQV